MMTRTWIVENTWNCTSCGAVNKGRFDACQTCAHQKDKGEVDNPVTGSEPAVTDPDLLRKAKVGPNAICQFCDGQVRLMNDKCPTCGATRTDTKPNAATRKRGWDSALANAGVDPRSVERVEHDGKVRAPDSATAPTAPFRPLWVGQDGTRTGTLIGFYWWVVRRATHRPVRALLTILAVIATLFTAGVGRTLRFISEYRFPLALAAGVGGVAALGFWLFLPRQVNVTVTEATWEWRADLRQKTLMHGSSWDEQMPDGAFNTQCESRQRGTEQCNRHACGSHSESYSCGSYSCNCHTTCTSNGNGFSTCSESCSTCSNTCTREVTDYCWDQCPVYDRWCSYDYYDWPIIQTAANGGDCVEDPRWPALAPNGPNQCVDHREAYRVGFTDTKKTWTIRPSTLTACRRYLPGARWLIKVNRAGQVWPQHPVTMGTP